jgi:hypothetical protein
MSFPNHRVSYNPQPYFKQSPRVDIMTEFMIQFEHDHSHGHILIILSSHSNLLVLQIHN